MQHQQHQPEPAIGMDIGRLRSETKTRQQGLCGLLTQLRITGHMNFNFALHSITPYATSCILQVVFQQTGNAFPSRGF
jgi:hypothetical protein